MKAAGCSKRACAVTVNARSGTSVLSPLGRLQAVREIISSVDNSKSDLFLDIFSPFLVIMT